VIELLTNHPIRWWSEVGHFPPRLPGSTLRSNLQF